MAALSLAMVAIGGVACTSSDPAGGASSGSGGDGDGPGTAGGAGGSDPGGPGNGANGGVPGGTGGAPGAGAAGGGGGSTDQPPDGGAPGNGGAPGGGGAPGDGGAPDPGPAVGPTPTAAMRMMCTGSDPIACHFGGAPGNYDVTVVLGEPTAGETIVTAEAGRVMLNAIPTGAGQARRFSFTVNVRQPEGEPIQAVPAGTPGLDLYFSASSGLMPRLGAIGYAPAAAPFVIYLAGDSTVCDQTSTDYAGWGQMIPPVFDYPVSIANYADSGESSGSFLGSGSLFGAISSRLEANDWVLIQFGHNDKTVTAATFHDNLTSMVTQVRARGAFPVLITPEARATFSGGVLTAQHINDTGANLPAIVKQVASEQSTPVLDLTARTSAWLTQVGPSGWQPYHALGTDATHTNRPGAAVVAGFVVELIRQANLTALTSRMRP